MKLSLVERNRLNDYLQSIATMAVNAQEYVNRLDSLDGLELMEDNLDDIQADLTKAVTLVNKVRQVL
jgi:hypothetical protein